MKEVRYNLLLDMFKQNFSLLTKFAYEGGQDVPIYPFNYDLYEAHTLFNKHMFERKGDILFCSCGVVFSFCSPSELLNEFKRNIGLWHTITYFEDKKTKKMFYKVEYKEYTLYMSYDGHFCYGFWEKHSDTNQ